MNLTNEVSAEGKIHTLLFRLGVTPNYTGFFHATHAAELVMGRPERLLLVIKWLYPDVAKHYRTTWQAVERNIRTAVSRAWLCNPGLLSELADRPLQDRPTTAEFVSILAAAASGHTPD